MELRLRCWPDGGCGDTKETTDRMTSRLASSVDMGPCQHGPCQPARFCKKSLLLLPASSAACCCCCCRWCCCCTRVHTRAAEYASVSPARGKVVSNGQEARSLVYAPLGEVWPIQSVRKVFGQQEAAVESHIDHIWLYHNMLAKYFV